MENLSIEQLRWIGGSVLFIGIFGFLAFCYWLANRYEEN